MAIKVPKVGLRQLLGFTFLVAVALSALGAAGLLRPGGIHQVTDAKVIEEWWHRTDSEGISVSGIKFTWTWTCKRGTKSIVVEAPPVGLYGTENKIPVGTLIRIVNGASYADDLRCVALAGKNKFAMKLPPGSDRTSLGTAAIAIVLSGVVVILVDRLTNKRVFVGR